MRKAKAVENTHDYEHNRCVCEGHTERRRNDRRGCRNSASLLSKKKTWEVIFLCHTQFSHASQTCDTHAYSLSVYDIGATSSSHNLSLNNRLQRPTLYTESNKFSVNKVNKAFHLEWKLTMMNGFNVSLEWFFGVKNLLAQGTDIHTACCKHINKHQG